MMWRLGNLLAVVTALISLLYLGPGCAQYVGSFQYPQGGETFNVIDTIIVQWTSNYPKNDFYAITWNATAPTDPVLDQRNVSQSGTLSYRFADYFVGETKWPIGVIYQIGYNPMNFNLSPPVNVTSTAGIPTTWALGTSYLTQPPTSTSSSSSSNNSSPAFGRLSTGAKIGIGVGIGVGALILSTSLLCFICAHRRARKLEEQQLDAATSTITGPSEQKYESSSADMQEIDHQSQTASRSAR